MQGRVPRVSIGVPVYNGQDYLGAALESLLGQTFDDFELIISDNASTDATPDICRGYAARDPRVRYFRAESNQGLAWNYNRVFRLARGEYFKWAAHDDVCDRTFLARATEVLDDDPSTVLCASASAMIDHDGNLIDHDGNLIDHENGNASPDCEPTVEVPRVWNGPPREFGAPEPHRRFLDVLINGIWCHEFYGLIRASVLRQTRLHRSYPGGDKVLLADLALRGRFYEIPDVLTFIRSHQSRVSLIASGSEQAATVGHRGRRRLVLPPRVRAVWDYLVMIPQAELSVPEQARCMTMLARYLLQVRKWKRVFLETLRGTGTSGMTTETAPAPAQPPGDPGRHPTSLAQHPGK